jgi:hypothetical protein
MGIKKKEVFFSITNDTIQAHLSPLTSHLSPDQYEMHEQWHKKRRTFFSITNDTIQAHLSPLTSDLSPFTSHLMHGHGHKKRRTFFSIYK